MLMNWAWQASAVPCGPGRDQVSEPPGGWGPGMRTLKLFWTLSWSPRGPCSGQPIHHVLFEDFFMYSLRSILPRVRFSCHWKIPEEMDCPQIEEPT